MSFDDLLSIFEQIKNESQDKANSAQRVGQALIDFLESSLIKGEDLSTSPNPPPTNTFIAKNDDNWKMALDIVLGGRGQFYLLRNLLQFSSEIILQAAESKIGAAVSQGELQERGTKSYLLKEKGIYEHREKRWVDGMLSEIVSQIELGKNELTFAPFINFWLQTGFTKENGDFVAANDELFFSLAKGLALSLNNIAIFGADAKGLYTMALSPELLEGEENYVAPYQQIRTNVLTYDVNSDASIDLKNRNESLVLPNSFGALLNPLGGTSTYEFLSLVLGTKLSFIARLAAGKSLFFKNANADLENVFPLLLPSGLSSSLSGISNNRAEAVNLLLEGVLVRKKSMYWKITEYSI